MHNIRVHSGQDRRCFAGTTPAFEPEAYALWMVALAIAAMAFHALLITGCASGGDSNTGSNDAAITTDGGTAGDGGLTSTPGPRWPDCDMSAKTQTVTFIHVADMHANYTPDINGISPVSRLRGYYEKVKRGNPFTLFTDGGDDHEKGSVADQYSQGRSTIEIVRAMMFDVRVMGNHDFAWDVDEALEFSYDPRALVLASNTRYNLEPDRFQAATYGELQVGCLKIGFFGMTPKPWNELDQEYEGDYYPDFKTRHDYVQAAREIVEARRGYVDLLVMVSHLGIGMDKEIAASVPGIDLILGGHSHTVSNQADNVSGSIIAHPGSSAAYAGRMDLAFDLSSRKVAGYEWTLTPNIADTLPVSKSMQATVEAVMQKYAPAATTAAAGVYRSQNEEGIARVTVQAALNMLKADAVVVDQSTIWSTWNEGGISAQQFLDTYKVERELPGTPGFNSMYTARVSAESLQLLKDNPKTGWTYFIPDTLEAGKIYKIAVQKRAAKHPEAYFPAGFSLEALSFEYETWELLLLHAITRQSFCTYLDEDVPIRQCGT